MIRLAISVEGQTEEEFVKEILAPHLRQYNVCATPILLGRAIGWQQGGGNVNIGRLVRDMKHLAHSFDYITSLVDFYGFKEKCQLGVISLKHEYMIEYRRITQKEVMYSYLTSNCMNLRDCYFQM